MPRTHTIGPVELWIYFNDTQKHRRPHFHAVTVDEQIVPAIPALAFLAGSLEGKAMRRVLAWAGANTDRLVAEWNRCNPQMPIGQI
jgi:hypothetical protein